MIKRFLCFFVAPLAFLFLFACRCGRAEEIRVVILHTNDIHGQVYAAEAKSGEETKFVGGLSAIALKVKSIREDARDRKSEVILVDAGDFYQGTPEGNTPPGELLVEFFNLAGYDYVVIGNHEYDFGEDAVKKFTKLAKFPFLAANILRKSTGASPEYVSPYAIRDVKGLKIAFIGLTHPEMAILVLPKVESWLDFPLESDTLRKVLAEKQVKEADFVVLLTHIGYNRDKALAHDFPDIPLIIGGHSHSLIRKPLRTKLGKALICQTGCKGENLGRVDIVFDSETRKAKSIEATIIPLVAGKRPEDKETDALIDKYAAPLREMFAGKVGIAEHAFPRGGKGYSGVSSPLGNVVTDVMREATGADITFHNRTGMRADLQQGEVTKRHLYNVSPFANTLVTMNLTGAEVLEAIEYSLYNSRYFLEVSGIEYTYGPKREVGKRVMEARVGAAALEKGKTYRIVTNSFIADGGDGHVTFTKGRNVKDTGIDILAATVDYVKRSSPLKRDYVQRIKKVANK
jgi:2',3'-cyclic-nucleotide 2'-phosphodiesterase (5'-nucleotidase family)